MPKKILIADDEPHIRLLLEQTLEDFEDEGVEINTASNGEDALAFIKDNVPDLVFLDVMMPKLSGFDVCSTVRNDFGLKEIFIIMLTAKGQETDRQRAEEAGANLYLTKPFNPDEIVSKTSEVLGIEL